MKTLLWLDDIRNPNDTPKYVPNAHEIIWVKSYYEFIDWIEQRNNVPDIISFDHDLADVNSSVEKTGYDCLKWLINYCYDNNFNLPEIFFHTDNTVGKTNMETYLNNAKKHLFK